MKHWFVGFCAVFFCVQLFAGERVGNRDLLKEKYWQPKEAHIRFFYEDNAIQGFEVSFKFDNTQLYREWKLKDDSGNLRRFPFILESTLIVEDKDEVALVSSSRGDGWDVEDNSQCLSSEVVYLDSQLLDLTADTFGIGILRPDAISENVEYKYYIKLRHASWQDSRKLTATLRFRLNIDIWEASDAGYRPWDDHFNMGNQEAGAKLAYNVLYYNYGAHPVPSVIANVFSFALADYGTNVLPNIPMFGSQDYTR